MAHAVDTSAGTLELQRTERRERRRARWREARMTARYAMSVGTCSARAAAAGCRLAQQRHQRRPPKHENSETHASRERRPSGIICELTVSLRRVAASDREDR